MTPSQTKLYCGECPFFRYEDTDGEGQCAVTRKNRYCGFRCCFTGGQHPEEMTAAHASAYSTTTRNGGAVVR